MIKFSIKPFFRILIVYPLAGVLTGIIVATPAFWAVSFNEARDIGIGFGLVVGSFLGIFLYPLFKNQRLVVHVPTMVGCASLMGILGYSHPVVALWFTVYGFLLAVYFLLLWKAASEDSRENTPRAANGNQKEPRP